MKVYSASTPTEAHIVCELLKTQRIDCEVRGEGIFGLQGEIPFGESSAPYVWLYNDEKLECAQKIIKEYEQSEHQGSWQCSGCGEVNEGQFGACWQCGTSAS